jgi:GAF domain-containing protein
VQDRERLATIASYEIFDPAMAVLLDGFAQRAAQHFHQDVGLVSIVLNGSQFFAGSYGLEGWLHEVSGTPIEWSFCAHAVRSRSSLVVEDATEDPRFRDNPLVTQDGIRSYAGAPLIASNGYALGTCCVLGLRARPFGAGEVAALEGMAAEVIAAMDRARDGQPA